MTTQRSYDRTVCRDAWGLRNVNRWLKESVLYEQPFRDSNMAVRDLIHDRIATIGENILVRRFTRYALGEEL